MKNERETSNRTELLYETDGMMTEFDAQVTAVSKDEGSGLFMAELDRTAFFPEGGGQPADTGELVFANREKAQVVDVHHVDGRVWHYTKQPVEEGVKVRGILDREKRFSRMQNHGAEHLVCGLIHNRFGYDNVGFHLTDKELVIDINGPLTKDQLSEIEEEANRIVFENVPVTISFPTEEEAKDIPYRSKIDDLTDIRLVTIEGYDICACCAPHVNYTGQFGSIKILSFMPHRGGTRITMIAGMDAYKDHVMLHEENAKVMECLSAQRDKTGAAVSEHNDRFLALKEENASLRKKMAQLVTDEILLKIRENGGGNSCVTFFTDDLDPVGLRNLVNACTKEHGGPVCAFLGNDMTGYRYIFGVGKDNAPDAGLKSLADDFNENCFGKGGGSDVMIQGTSSASRKDIEEYFAKRPEKA